MKKVIETLTDMMDMCIYFGVFMLTVYAVFMM